MADCSYCGRSFEDEEAHLEHLRDEHRDELGRIDERRIRKLESDGGSIPRTYLAVGAVALVAVIAAVAVLGSGGGGGDTAPPAGDEPTDLWSVHYHGDITMTVEGNQVDFSRSSYQMQADPFHFENGNGQRWHVHARGVTLQYAMGTLGINVTEETVTYQGTTYRDSDDGTTVRVLVDGEPVDPSTYVLQEGDSIRIAVES